MAISPGATLRKLRARRPLVHQITNYVVMNETANATLALGALPVMAHAPEEVEEMAANAGALVLNIGTLSEHWIEAMLLAGKAAKGPIVLDPVGAGATRYRTETAKRLLDELDITVVRGTRPRSPRSPAGRPRSAASSRSAPRATAAELAREAARALGTIVSVTGPTDHVSDGERVVAISNGHELIGTVCGTGCMSTAVTGSFLAAKPEEPLEAAAEALAAFGVAGEDAARDAQGPGTFHARSLRRALQPRPGHARRPCEGDRVKLHAIVDDLDTARIAVEGGASVLQLRLKGATTEELIERGAPFRLLATQYEVTFVVNDDVQAALALLADGVHLGRDDEGSELAVEAGMMLGRSAADPGGGEGGGARGRRVHRRRPGLGDAEQAGRRSADRPRRAPRDQRRGPDSGDRDRRNRRDERTRVRRRRRVRRRGHPRRGSDRRAQCGSLTSASSASSPSWSAAASRRRSSTTRPRSTGSSSRRTHSSRACTSGSTGSPFASSGFAPRPSTSATSRRRAPSPSGLVVSLGAPPDTAVDDLLELYEGIAETGVPVVGGDTTRADTLVLSVTALGRSERVPGRAGAEPGDLLVVTGPLGAAGAAFREGRTSRPPLRLDEGRRLARTAHAMLDISDGIARDAGHIAHRSGVRCVIELDRVPLAEGATIDDLGFGEDFELLAAVPEPDFHVVGRCEEGEGVELLRDGKPYPLTGWDHFRETT